MGHRPISTSSMSEVARRSSTTLALADGGGPARSGAGVGFRIVRMVGSGGSERSSRMDLRAIRNPALDLRPGGIAHLDKLDERGPARNALRVCRCKQRGARDAQRVE